MQWFSACISKYLFKYCLFCISLRRLVYVCNLTRTCSFAIVDLNFLSLFILFSFLVSNIRTYVRISYQRSEVAHSTKIKSFVQGFFYFIAKLHIQKYLIYRVNRSIYMAFFTVDSCKNGLFPFHTSAMHLFTMPCLVYYYPIFGLCY